MNKNYLKNKGGFVLIILLSLLLSCASQHEVVDKQPDEQYFEQLEPGDALEFLSDLSTKAKHKHNEFNEREISEMIATFDSLCENEIIVSKSHNFDRFQQKVDNTYHLDTVLIQYAAGEKDNYLATSFRELKFRVLVKSQDRLNEIFENEQAYQKLEQQRKKQEKEDYRDFESHRGWVFKQNVSYMLPYIQANQKYSSTKSSYLSDVIQSLPQIEHKSEKRRAWLAIDRMLNEIDITKSGSGYRPFQRSAHGIYTKPGKILNQLKAQHEKETDEEIVLLSSKIIKKVENKLIAKRDRQFWDTVEESRNLNRRFKTALQKTEVEATIDGLTASEWFDMGFASNNNFLKIEYYSKAIELDPQYAAAYTNRGNAYQNIGKPIAALQDLNKSIEFDSLYAPSYLNRGNIYQNLGRYTDAVRDYSRALLLEPGYTLAYDYRGRCYKNLSKYEHALRDFSNAIELEPNYATAYNNRGDAYRYLGKHQQAIQDYTQAIELDPNYVLAYNNRGICYRSLKKYNRAILDHRKALEIMPNSAVAYYNLGCVYWEVKNWNSVIKNWKKCLEIDPNHKQALEWLPKANKEAKRLR